MQTYIDKFKDQVLLPTLTDSREKTLHKSYKARNLNIYYENL